ncbi:ATP-dependent DNA helicase [Planctellipticum variicoloris]|uniref:ATP-dependent DNA helicase n=1 Tax=Planctellipticum variicoloris TaxID=3064265 RepID=UPI003013C592|nr:ATP-dependent RecD-like DNA helicase [Planctomycetaceae bacterium SH412]
MNTSCLKLKAIAPNRDDQAEEQSRGRSFAELLACGQSLPPCFDEHASFMAAFDLVRQKSHPYARTNPKTHGHFRPTTLRYPSYSAAAIPFRWLMQKEVFGAENNNRRGFRAVYPLADVSEEFEPELPFSTNWIQDYRNHTALLNCFWNHVQTEDSLVFFYAKQIPLVEDAGRRVLIGVGRVKHLGPLTEYEYEGSKEGAIRSLLWERMVTHSIRPDFVDGFLLPYHEALEQSDNGRRFDPAKVVAFVPDDHIYDFSYVTEHVGNDAAIGALQSIREALHHCADHFGYAAADQERWIDRELGRLWQRRGAWPGIGAVLSATGVALGNFVAQYLIDRAGDSASPWPVWDHTLSNLGEMPSELSQVLDSTIAASWKRMKPTRRAFLDLLSRLALSGEQAEVLATPEGRQARGITISDEAILENPYLLYEATRLMETPVSINVVDRGVFPSAAVRRRNPIPEPSLVKSAVDARRLRAMVIRQLESAANDGHTLQPRASVIQALRDGQSNDDDSPTLVTADLLEVAEHEVFDGEIRVVTMAHDSTAYQLERLAAAGDRLRRTIDKRVVADRHALVMDWRQCLNQFLPSNEASSSTDPQELAIEEQARQEKTAALNELAAARFSALIGRAGTGKTTVLSVLCAQPQINNAGVLLLAPTGKARVTMEEVARRAGSANTRAMTVAQYLSASCRYDFASQRYRMLGQTGDEVVGTVIVDECSMLTEEMLAAIFESLKKAERLILVGDYRQLPPIGAGRPFVDIVARLHPEKAFAAGMPHVAPSFAELMIPRRQGSGDRADLVLASWFSGGETSAGDDHVFGILSGTIQSDTLKFRTWETPAELQGLIPVVLREALAFDPELEEWQAFCKSLGGVQDKNGSFWFNNKWRDRDGSGTAAENWQILSPVRQRPWGVEALNRFIHQHFKSRQIEQARNPGPYRSIPSPKGDEQLVYGDKVMNVRNRRVHKSRIYPRPESSGYLVNGEIGIAVGHRRTKARSSTPENLEIEFSTQPGLTFAFYNSDFSDDGEASLELAYALSVHKAQGSEFETVILVLPRSSLMVTRELLYTALTRQKKQVIVLLQGTAVDLHRFSSDQYSASACRLTNLFRPPKPIHVKNVFLEEFLIHHTTRGELVRSKSEVIVANLLNANKIDYAYEQPLEIDGSFTGKFPDFTIHDDDAGVTYYWEHLGMLGDAGYKRRWEEKEQWYADQGILRWDATERSPRRLIITSDGTLGEIDSAEIERLIQTVFG